jgi:hypothetical protein
MHGSSGLRSVRSCSIRLAPLDLSKRFFREQQLLASGRGDGQWSLRPRKVISPRRVRSIYVRAVCRLRIEEPKRLSLVTSSPGGEIF